MTERSVMVRIKGDVSDLNRALMSAGKNVKSFANDLETSNDRATWLAQGLTAIVPAVAPIAAQAAPAIAGMTTQLLSAGAAAGVTVLAFQGVGDAMKASLAYEAAPTAANLQKLQEAMQNISPAAREFVTQVNDLMPQLKGLRDIAATNMFPGFSQGLDDLITLLPRARDLIGSVADENGRLAAEGAKALAGPEFRSFFDYVQRNAAPTTAELGRTIGNVTKGLAELLMAFEPAEQSWSQGMLNMSRSFERWASGVGQTKGFEEFLDYLETSGPQVLDTVGALAKMILEVGEAAAPLGGPTLAGIRAFANAVSAIADSPLGPVIIGAAAAVSALSRALAVSELLFKKNDAAATGFGARAVSTYKAQASAITQLPTAFRATAVEQKRLVAAQAEAAVVQSKYVRQLQTANTMTSRPDLNNPTFRQLGRLDESLSQVEKANARVGEATKRAAEAEANRGRALRESAAGFGKTAAGVAGLTVATTGMADGIGISNTATLGLAGTMAGPFGAAIGVTVGGFVDARQAAKSYEDALSGVSRASARGDFAGLAKNLSDFTKQSRDLNKVTGFGDLISDAGKSLGAVFSGDFSTNLGARDAKVIAEKKAQLESMSSAYRQLASDLGRPLPANASLGQIAQVADSAEPALRQLGLTINDLSSMDGASRSLVVEQIKQIMTAADSTKGRTDAFKGSLVALDDSMLSNADSAGKMAAALDALLSPSNNAEKATDAWLTSLQALGKQLKSNSAGFKGTSADAIANRAASQSYLDAAKARLAALAANGASSGRIAGALKEERARFIQAGVAAGYSAKEMRARAAAMGLTPKLIRTVMQVVGLKNVDKLVSSVRRLPRGVRTYIEANGIPKTQAGLRALQRRYNLTPKQVRTLALLRDQTPAVQRRVLAALRRLDATKANPKANLQDNASRKIASIRAQLGALNGTAAFTYAYTVQQTIKKNAAGGLYPERTVAFADGGTWGSSPDRKNGHLPHLAKAGTYRVFAEDETNGEAYIPLANDWRRPRAKEIAAATVGMLGGQVEWFAQGGMVPAYATTVSSGSTSASFKSGPTIVKVYVDGEEFRNMAYEVAGDVVDGQAEMDDMITRAGAAYGKW